MIEGLKFDFTTEQLATHLNRKIEHHAGRVVFYNQKAASLEGAEAAQFTGGDPIHALKSKAAEHDKKHQMFCVLREHLVPNETYRLEDKDLVRLEIVSGGGYW